MRQHKLLLLLVGFSLLVTPFTWAGSVFVSGHDSDFHAVAGNTTGARNIINAGLDFARDGNTLPILFIQTDLSNLGLGDHLNSESGLIASGYTAGNTTGDHYVMVNATAFATVDLSLYSAIFVPSDHGGTLTEADLHALNSRSGDILNYINAGGGLVAFAEDGNHTGGNSEQLFGFLPFLVTSSPLGEFENGNVLTPFGSSLGLLNSDINGNFSHNVFTATGGMNVVDYDAGGEILSLAYRGRLTPTGTGAVPEPATLTFFGSGVLLLTRRLRKKSR